MDWQDVGWSSAVHSAARRIALRRTIREKARTTTPAAAAHREAPLNVCGTPYARRVVQRGPSHGGPDCLPAHNQRESPHNHGGSGGPPRGAAERLRDALGGAALAFRLCQFARLLATRAVLSIAAGWYALHHPTRGAVSCGGRSVGRRWRFGCANSLGSWQPGRSFQPQRAGPLCTTLRAADPATFRESLICRPTRPV